mgnify:CR=1 FL=1
MGLGRWLRQGNGPEFTSHALELWAEQHAVKLDFIKPGKPTQNAFIERFNLTYRNKVLDCYLFKSSTEVRETTDSWMEKYNYERPHESLNDLPPKLYEQLKQENSIEIWSINVVVTWSLFAAVSFLITVTYNID